MFLSKWEVELVTNIDRSLFLLVPMIKLGFGILSLWVFSLTILTGCPNWLVFVRKDVLSQMVSWFWEEPFFCMIPHSGVISVFLRLKMSFDGWYHIKLCAFSVFFRLGSNTRPCSARWRWPSCLVRGECWKSLSPKCERILVFTRESLEDSKAHDISSQINL